MVGGFNGPGERTTAAGSAGRGDAGVSTTYLFSSLLPIVGADRTTGSLTSFGALLLLVISVAVTLDL
jgi:hypothetical protein